MSRKPSRPTERPVRLAGSGATREPSRHSLSPDSPQCPVCGFSDQNEPVGSLADDEQPTSSLVDAKANYRTPVYLRLLAMGWTGALLLGALILGETLIRSTSRAGEPQWVLRLIGLALFIGSALLLGSLLRELSWENHSADRFNAPSRPRLILWPLFLSVFGAWTISTFFDEPKVDWSSVALSTAVTCVGASMFIVAIVTLPRRTRTWKAGRTRLRATYYCHRDAVVFETPPAANLRGAVNHVHTTVPPRPRIGFGPLWASLAGYLLAGFFSGTEEYAPGWLPRLVPVLELGGVAWFLVALAFLPMRRARWRQRIAATNRADEGFRNAWSPEWAVAYFFSKA